MPPVRNTPRRSRRGANRPPVDPEFEDIDSFGYKWRSDAGTDSTAVSPASTTTGATPTSTPATSPEPEYSSDDDEYEEPARTVTRSKRSPRPPAAKNEDRIKRPPNMFMLYRSNYIESRKAEVAGVNRSLISKDVGILWRGLPDDQREYWKAEAEEAKRLHAIMYPDYVYAPQPRQKSRAKPANSRGGNRRGKARYSVTTVEAAGGGRRGRSRVVDQAAWQMTTRSRTSRVAHAIKIEDAADEDVTFPSTPISDGDFSPAATPTVNGDEEEDDDDFPGSPSTVVGDVEDDCKTDNSIETVTYMGARFVSIDDIPTLDLDEDEDEEDQEEKGERYFKDIFADDAFTSEEDALREALAELELKNEMEAQPACVPSDPWDILPFDFATPTVPLDFATSTAPLDSATESFEAASPYMVLDMNLFSAMDQTDSEPCDIDSWWSYPSE